MKRYQIIGFLLLIAVGDGMQADVSKWDQIGKQVIGKVKSIGSGFTKMGKSLRQMVGNVPDTYHYSFRVWNDTNQPVIALTQEIVNIMGVAYDEPVWDKGFLNGKKVDKWSDSGSFFDKQQLYFAIWLSKNFNLVKKKGSIGEENEDIAEQNLIHKHWDISSWRENDEFTYHYRAYGRSGKPKAESLGFKLTSSEFSGQFYNMYAQNDSAGENVTLTLQKDGKKHTVTLEPHSCSLLQSTAGAKDSVESIRPAKGKKRNFTFNQTVKGIGKTYLADIPIASKGLAEVKYIGSKDKQKKKKEALKLENYVPSSPMIYTYEVYKTANGQPSVGTQGLQMGNYDQPNKMKDVKTGDLRVRDINPVTVSVWVQSSTQAQAADLKLSLTERGSDVPFDLPGTIWAAYKTDDSSIFEKITPGAVSDFTIIRPQIKEKSAWFFVVSLQTADDTKAKAFLKRLCDGTIGAKAVSTDITKPLDTKNILQKMQANQNGIIDDTKGAGNSGVSGFVLLADEFYPKGVGSFRPFYYLILSPRLAVNQLLNTLFVRKDLYTKGTPNIEPKTKAELTKNIVSWIGLYPKNKSQVEKEVLTFLQQKGNRDLYFDNPTASGAQLTLSDRGKVRYNDFLTGPVSIKNFPVTRKAGTNYYTYLMGRKPSSKTAPYWPK